MNIDPFLSLPAFDGQEILSYLTYDYIDGTLGAPQRFDSSWGWPEMNSDEIPLQSFWWVEGWGGDPATRELIGDDHSEEGISVSP
jgi:hypothetical protein